MSEAVLVDSQFSVAKVFKPFPNFEDVYEGLPATTPIAFPGTLDSNAGKPGYDPNLLAGIPCPLGAKLTLWIPNIVFGPNGTSPYIYKLIWRLRNLQDFRDPTKRAAYHYPKQTRGQNDQFVIPSGAKTILYEDAIYQDGIGAGFQNLTRTSSEGIIAASTGVQGLQSARTPTNQVAAYQQGLGAGFVGANTDVTFNVFQVDAEGDELIILAYRDLGANQPPWGFAGLQADTGFSLFYGNGSGKILPDVGIYVFSGSNP